MKKDSNIYHIVSLFLIVIISVLGVNLITGCAKGHRLQTMQFKPVPPPKIPSQELPPLATIPPVQAMRVAGQYFEEAKQSLQKGDKKTAEEKYLTARRTLISGGIVPGIFRELNEFWEQNMVPEPDKKIKLEPMNTYKIIEGLKGASPYNSIEFPFPVPERVLCEIEDAQNRYPDRFQEGLDRSGYYNPYIREQLKQAGLPQELCWVAMIESMYKLKAYSSAGAAGMWQFIRSTGKNYNLRIDSYVDERYNWVAATSAAINYMQRLHDFFNGSWELAISAYNMGEGGMLRAINANGGDRNFWTLIETAPACYRIKEETKKYYPRFLAYILICNDPVSYGFSPSSYAPMKWDEFEVQGMYALDILDKAMGYQPGTLATWNPFLVREVTPPQGCKLMLPSGDSIKLAEVLKNPSTRQTEFIAYTVKKGESAYHIAREHGITVEELLKINELNSVKSIKTGKTIQVPSVKKGSTTFAKKENKEQHQSEQSYIVKKGDTLFSIAKKHNVEVEDLANWNGIRGNQMLKIGDKIALKPTQEQKSDFNSIAEQKDKGLSIKNIYYTVNSGDTISAIAKKLSTRPENIMEMNNLSAKSILHVGQKLIIRKETIEEENKSEPFDVASNISTEKTNFSENHINKIYEVQKGDTLGKIASLNKIKLDNLKKWNNINDDVVIKIGQKLYLYNPESQKVETAKIETAKIETASESKTPEKVYVVKQGDTLSKIAEENNVSLKSILESNNLKEDTRLQIGQKIVLSQNLTKVESVKPQLPKEDAPINITNPQQDKDNKSNITSPPESLKVVEHKVQPGESLWSISKKYNTNITMITQKNPGINSESLKVGTKLLIPSSEGLSPIEPKTMAVITESKQQSTAQTKPAAQQVEKQAEQTLKSTQASDCTTYQVKPGDNLWLIARRNNVSVSEITQWNNMDNAAQLKIGQTIKIYSNGEQRLASDSEKAGQITIASMENKKEEQKQVNTYIVQKGDSLYTISKKTGVPLKKLLEINNFDEAKVLHIGENVKITQ